MELKNNNIAFFNIKLINLFINQLIKKGKKSKGIKILKNVIFNLKEKYPKINPLLIIKKAIYNVKPYVEIKTFKQRNFSIQQPVQISKERQNILAIKWILQSAKSRKEKGFSLKLTNEIIDAYNNTGNSVLKKIQMHKLAVLQKRYLFFNK